MTTTPDAHLEADIARWERAWPEALAQWGPSLRLQPPRLMTDPGDDNVDSLAWFDLGATTVSINLRKVQSLGLLHAPVQVLAHEIGHHILAPADRTTSARIVARCAKGLVDLPQVAPLMANVWTDTLINDRLQRQRGLAMDVVYRSGGAPASPWMQVWMRGFELLWTLPNGSLCGAGLSSEMDADALLLARHARAFARDPVGGAGGFAALLRQWIPPTGDPQDGRLCRQDGASTEALDGVALDDSLDEPVLHPAMDPRVNPEAPVPERSDDALAEATAAGRSGGQAFGPARLTELYTSLGMERDAAVDWYVARAQQHLIPYPTTHRPVGVEEELQGWDPWDVGEDLGEVDWLATVVRSPVVIPGRTTVQRAVDREPLATPSTIPVNLDLYVDSSGSMPDPRSTLSPSVLAGTVLALSALRAGAAVQVTVWASAHQVARTTGGYLRDRHEVVRTLLHYWGGGTVFPLEHLAADHPAPGRPRRPWEPDTHICVISDWGVTSMFGAYQREGLQHAAADALVSAGGGGSLVLREGEDGCDLIRAQAGDYEVYAVPQERDLVPFARAFARVRWGSSRPTTGAASAGTRPDTNAPRRHP